MNKYDFSEFSQLSSARMAKFKISDYGNIATDTTITVQKEGLTPITFTSKTSGASGLQFNTSNDQTAINLVLLLMPILISLLLLQERSFM